MSKSGSRKSTSFRWAQALSESSTPVFLLDAKRRLILFNRGCSEWTGWTFDELPNQACNYVTEADPHSPEAVLAACAPPAEVWLGSSVDVPCSLPHRSDPVRAGRIRFQPLKDAEQRVVQVWGQFLSPQDAAASPPATPSQLLHAELAALRQQIRSRYGADTVVAQSVPMRRVLAQLSAARLSSGCVLFVGESGTGREHLARALHERGPHSKRSFVPIDCRRSTGAELKRLLKQTREDRLELEALRTGTWFLRDIAAAPRDVQERIAEWLREKSESEPPRVTAAVTDSLSHLVEQDQFDRDLYFQLTTQVIELPRLADRPEDILPLAQFFLQERNRHADRQLSGFNPEAMEALRRYRWPNHVAELSSVVDFAAEHAAGPLVSAADFPLSFRSGQDAQQLGPPVTTPIQPLDEVLKQVERDQIQAALAASRENLTKAAELLGMSRPKLYRRLEALGLLPPGPNDP